MSDPSASVDAGPEGISVAARSAIVASLAGLALVCLVAVATGPDPEVATDPLDPTTTLPPANTLPDGGIDPTGLVPLFGGVPLPEIDETAWIGEPVDPDALDDAVVLHWFFAPACLDCVADVASVRAWHDRYTADGLVVLPVVLPRWSFEADPALVEGWARDQQLDLPVALDVGGDIAEAVADFGVRSSPVRLLSGRDGVVRFIHPGGGATDDTEDVLRALLGVPATAPRAGIDVVDPVPDDDRTGDLLLGSEFSTTFHHGDEALADGPGSFPSGATPESGHYLLGGGWDVTADAVTTTDASGTLVAAFHARRAAVIVDPGDAAPVLLETTLDGVTDTVEIDGPGLYPVPVGETAGEHELVISVPVAGVTLHALQFGD